LVDRATLNDLATAYCWAVDSRDWGTWANLFLPEGGVVFPFGAVRQHRMAEFAATILDGYPMTNHLIANFWCDIEGDRARFRVYLRAAHMPDLEDLTRHADVGGIYIGEASRVDGEWKFLRVEAVFACLDGEAFQAPSDWKFDDGLVYEAIQRA
jgi:hypothetical protein